MASNLNIKTSDVSPCPRAVFEPDGNNTVIDEILIVNEIILNARRGTKFYVVYKIL